MGGIYGCTKCDTVYTQTSGGMFPTHGGESFACDPGRSFKAVKYKKAKELRVHQNDWKDPQNDDYGRWGFSKVGFGESYYFDTKEEAEGWLAVYVKSLRDDLPYPNCDKCDEKTEEYGFSGSAWCQKCKRIWNHITKKWMN